MSKTRLFLFALSPFPNPKGYCHRTILMRGKDIDDARSAVFHKLKGNHDYIGKGKEVNYV